MTTIKTQDLTGAALDWAVAQVHGTMGAAPWVYHNLTGAYIHDDTQHNDEVLWSPSTNWSQGGPLIEQFNIGVCPTDFEWVAQKDSTDMSCQCDGVGPTPLIAAFRAIVAAKLGDEVDVPEELV